MIAVGGEIDSDVCARCDSPGNLDVKDDFAVSAVGVTLRGIRGTVHAHCNDVRRWHADTCKIACYLLIVIAPAKFDDADRLSRCAVRRELIAHRDLVRIVGRSGLNLRGPEMCSRNGQILDSKDCQDKRRDRQRDADVLAGVQAPVACAFVFVLRQPDPKGACDVADSSADHNRTFRGIALQDAEALANRESLNPIELVRQRPSRRHELISRQMPSTKGRHATLLPGPNAWPSAKHDCYANLFVFIRIADPLGAEPGSDGCCSSKCVPANTDARRRAQSVDKQNILGNVGWHRGDTRYRPIRATIQAVPLKADSESTSKIVEAAGEDERGRRRLIVHNGELIGARKLRNACGARGGCERYDDFCRSVSRGRSQFPTPELCALLSGSDRQSLAGCGRCLLAGFRASFEPVDIGDRFCEIAG